MNSVSYTTARKDLGKLMTEVCAGQGPLIVRRRDAEPVVLLSLADFQALAGTVAGSGRAEGMPWISPHLTVRHVPTALDFYERAFGFGRRNVVEDEGVTMHAEMGYRDMVVMMAPEGAYGATVKAPVSAGVESPVGLYVYCPDVDALYRHATAEGAGVVLIPQDMFWGDRICRLLDPEGYVWTFATRRGGDSG